MNFFKSRKKKELEEQFFKYFKVESGEDEEGNAYTEILADIKDDDIKNWLYTVTRSIQKSFTKQGIQNYLSAQMTIGGQKIEFSFLRDYKEGPHQLRMKAESRVKELEVQIKKLNEFLASKGYYNHDI